MRHRQPKAPVKPRAPRKRPAHARPAAKADDPYLRLFDVSPFPAVVSRVHDHTVLAVNARTAELIGVSQRDAIVRSVADY